MPAIRIHFPAHDLMDAWDAVEDATAPRERQKAPPRFRAGERQEQRTAERRNHRRRAARTVTGIEPPRR